MRLVRCMWITVVLGWLMAGTCQAFYNPSTGRWLNRDPIGERGGMNQYGFVSCNPVNETDVLGLVVGNVFARIWKPFVSDSFLNHVRGWQVELVWTPPHNDTWDEPCACNACQKVIWTQDVQFGGSGKWRKDWDEDDKHGLEIAVLAWECEQGGSSEARLFDTPDQHGGSVFFFKSPYSFHARSFVKCVAGRDAGKIYHEVDWGFTWTYDNTPQGIGPIYVKYEIAE